MIKLNEIPIHFQKFNDGSCRARIAFNIYEGVATITWLYENDEELLHLFYLVKHIRAHNIDNIFLIMPYIPNARMDRAKQDWEVFTLKYFCELINSLNFKSITVYDPHSPVSTALLNNISVINPVNEIITVMKKYPEALLFFPDEGSMKRLHNYFEMPYAFGVKERNWETQKIESLRIIGARHLIAGRDIIICDDILSRGSTLYLSAKQLKEMGAKKIYVFISHCENTVLGPHLNGQSLLDIPNLIEKIYTTNSIFTDQHNKIEIIKEF